CADVNATLAANGIQFINKHDARGFGFGLLKEVTDARGAHADEHFDKVTPTDGKEGNMGLACDRPRQQGFAGAGRADQENSLWNVGAYLFVTSGVFEEINDLSEFKFGFLAAGDVVEGDFRFLFGDQSSPAIPESQEGFAGSANATTDERPDKEHDPEWNDPGEENLRQEIWPFAAEAHTGLFQFADQVRVFHADRAEERFFVTGGLERRFRSV